MKPSIARMREVLAYSPETGRLTWRVTLNNFAIAGTEAGSIHSKGYIEVQVDGCKMRAHRAIFAMVKGRWPTSLIDHEDRDRTNNRWINLREANYSQNAANSRLYKNNSTGFKGVSRNGSGFKATICFERNLIHLGTYSSPAEAHAAYAAKAKELFGDFSAT